MASLAIAMVAAMNKNKYPNITFSKKKNLYFLVPLNVKSDFFREVLK